MEQLYRIGMFAKMNKVTIKTLRYYDEINLLKPAYINQENNYRYYSSFQISVLHKIISLKQLGCSISEIKQVLEGADIATILKDKKVELIEEVDQRVSMLAKIEYYLNNPVDERESNVIIKKLPPTKVITYRRIISSYEQLNKYFPYLYEKILETKAEIKLPEYCFCIYHDGDYRDEDIDVELCQSVVEIKSDTDEVKFKEFPGVKQAACLLHHGPYDNLRSTYQKLVQWIEENDYLLVDNPRESYIDGIWNKNDVADWLTEVQIPIIKK